MMPKKAMVAAIFAAALVAACRIIPSQTPEPSGMAGGPVAIPLAGKTTGRSTGTLVIAVRWPELTGRYGSQAIPESSDTLEITVMDGQATIATASIDRPASTATISDIPAKSGYTAEVEAHPAAPSAAVTTASGTATFDIHSSADTQLTVTLTPLYAPTVSSVAGGAPGDSIAITGTNFTQDWAGSAPLVTFQKSGGGTTAGTVTAFSAGSITVSVPSDAQGGTVTVTQDGLSATGTFTELARKGRLAAGFAYGYYVGTDGTVRAWGRGTEGQLGNGANTTSNVPVSVSGLSSATAVAAGTQVLARLSDGTVWGWGINDVGQIGDGTTTNRSTPVQVPGITTATAVAANTAHSLALLADGTVMAWGSNQYGMLGDGTQTNRSTPGAVSGLSGVTALAAGGIFSVALLSDGSVRTWGYGSQGQLGNGTNNVSLVPVQVTGLTGATAVCAGTRHVMALVSDGSIRAWGQNSFGGLGNGTTTDSSVPVTVTGISDAVALACGPYSSYALLSDGTVKAWGRNNVGQLGNGGTTDVTTPVALGLTGVVGIAASATPYDYLSFALALKSDGTVWSWGEGSIGQLGTGTYVDSSSPVQVSGLP